MTAQKTVTVHDTCARYDGWIKVDEYTVSHTSFEGETIGPFKREVMDRKHAVAVVLYDPKKDTVVLIKQFRLPVYLAPIYQNPEEPWLWEIVAGMIEPNESPADVAVRETYEETGLNVTNLQPIRAFYMSPGASTEIVHLFYGEVDSTKVDGIHGLDSEHEDILVEVVAWSDIQTMMEDTSMFLNALILLGLHWLKDHRQK